jgi:hypothetical protein
LLSKRRIECLAKPIAFLLFIFILAVPLRRRMRRSIKLPSDPNQRAAEIVRLPVEEPEQMRAGIARKGGLKGGKARAGRLPANKRKAIARKAAKARWSKK